MSLVPAATKPDLPRLSGEHARRLGFDHCGMARVEEIPELDHFEPWINAGKHGEMGYLATRNDSGELKRGSLGAAAPWARSVIVCALNYNSAPPYSTEVDRPRGWISRYAWFGEKEGLRHTDYHDAFLARLRQLES